MYLACFKVIASYAYTDVFEKFNSSLNWPWPQKVNVNEIHSLKTHKTKALLIMGPPHQNNF